MIVTLKSVAIALLIAFAPAPHVVATAAEEQCFQDWSEAAPVVRKEALRSAKDVRDLARKHRKGQVLTITLCQDSGKYVYKLVILGEAGRVENVTVDALAPFERQGER